MKLHLPYFSEKTRVKACNEVLEVKAYQIIVWVSVASDATAAWDSRIPRFPAILDIGNNHNFAITDTHLLKWAGIHAASLVELKTAKEERKSRCCRAALWLHTDGIPGRSGLTKESPSTKVIGQGYPPWVAGPHEEPPSIIDLRQHQASRHPHAAQMVLAVLIPEKDLVRQCSRP